MKAKSIKGKSVEEIKTALDESMTDGFMPTLAITFSSVNQDRHAIQKVANDAGFELFGVTTNGEFIDEVTDKGSVVMLLLDLNTDYFKIFFDEYPNKNHKEVARAVASRAKATFGKPAFILGMSNPSADGEEVLRGIEEVIEADVNAFGGAAGDDYVFAETFVYTNHKISNNGIVCIAFDQEKVAVCGVATCGWKAVGTEKTVTRSEGNHVFTIDGQPALDITTKYGGLENVQPENESLLIEIAANFPLQLQRDKGDPVMRPPLVVDWTDRSFFTSGSVPQGSKIRFSLPPDWDVMEKVVKGVQHLKDTEMPEADALVVFSCAGRILSFGPMMTSEIEGIKEVWNVPMAGMFSNAELGRMADGNLEMHNLTTCCVALKEK